MELNKDSNYKWQKIIISIAITTLALWLSFRKLDWSVVKEAYLQVNLLWIVLALANTMLVVYALGWRWQLLLKSKEKIPLSKLFRLNIISQYVNIIVPGRFGEVSKAYIVSKRYSISGAFTAGTIVIEKILDFFVFVLLWIFIPTIFSLEKEVRGYKIALFFCVITSLFIAFSIWRPKIVLKWASFLSRLLPSKLRQSFQDVIEKGIEAFSLLKETKTFFLVAVLTFAFVGGQVLTNFLLFKAFSFNLSFWVGLFLLLALQVGNIPPSVPGKVGIFEYTVILALSLFSIPKSQALSYGIMLHLVAFVPKILLGLLFLSSTDFTIRKAQQKQV